MLIKCFWSLIVVITLIFTCLGADLSHSEIEIVTNETRYTTLHPDAHLVVFNKVYHVKGNYVFSSGEQISGTHLLLNFVDEIQFTRGEDIEVLLKYPAKSPNGSIITYVEIYSDLTSKDADAYFVDGGIDQEYAEILLACNRTQRYSYNIFMYGY